MNKHDRRVLYRRLTSSLLGIYAECQDCNFRLNNSSAEHLARNHARGFGHAVLVKIDSVKCFVYSSPFAGNKP